jgi:cell division protease FtsH
MTRVRSLAASQRSLADVLVDALRAGSTPAHKMRSNDLNGRDQFDLRLDIEDVDEDDTPQVLRPDEVAAAVLLGRALDHNREALAQLLDPDTIAVIEVPATEYVDIIARLIKVRIIGADHSVLEENLPKDGGLAVPRTVVIFRRKDDTKTKKQNTDNGNLAAAVQWRCAIVGIAADPDRLLPRDLLRLAEHRIVLPSLDGAAIGAVIEAVTGRHPGAVDDALARQVTLETLMIAVRADLGAERSLARLTSLLDQMDANAELTPLLSEMHGLGAAKDWGLALAHDLKDYAAGRLSWAAVDKGALLTSAPGCGKTSFARALAREAGVYFVATSYAQWQAYKDGHLGHVTQAIRNTFAEARKNSPAIVFIDEIDTIPARRSGSDGSGSGKWNDEWFRSITNTLLECLDGFERREGTVVIAACNADPSVLDPALVRSGRLDRHIHIPLPDVPALMGIFRTHLGSEFEGVDLRAAALAARGHTGADVERWVRDARRKARIAKHPLDLQVLLDVVRDGEAEWPADVRRRIAHHEAGHAVAMLAVGLGEPTSLSIGALGGYAESKPGEMRSLTRAHIENHLVVLLAGRASEELVFGEGSAGAGGSEGSDLARATKLATELEVSFGLGSFGLLCPGGERANDLMLFEHLATAVRQSLDRAYAVALAVLAENRRTLDVLADALFNSGYLERSEIEAVLAQAPLHTKNTTDAPALQASQQSAAARSKPAADAAISPDTNLPTSEVAGISPS